jgi:metal-responsive CopG/Arc/MetJ family transcriptional regulator
MSTVKTAISINKKLYNEVEKLSNKLKLSRSQIFSQAVEYIIKRKKNLELLQKINQVYNDSQNKTDDILSKKIKSKHSKLVKGTW